MADDDDGGGLRGPQFVIVGTPRSGTTLVQRLVCEHPGTRVTPETHFFSVFFDSERNRLRFPLDGALLRSAVERYLAVPHVRDIGISTEDVLHRLAGTSRSPWDLFAGVVAALGKTPSGCVGEKTPAHLQWWRPLSQASGSLRFIAVLRDPRAVVSSMREAPFGLDQPHLLAVRWRTDAQQLQRARATLGERRLLVVRYEQLVERPDEARAAIGQFLSLSGEAVPIDARRDISLFPAWEAGWKARALQPISSEGAQAWREKLSEREVAQVELVAGSTMRQLGYEPTAPARRSRTALSLREVAMVARSWRRRRAKQREIDEVRID